MKVALAFAAAMLFAVPAQAAVGVSVALGQPEFYGHIDIGGTPPPVLVYRKPMLVQQTEGVYPPVYLRVRAGEADHWAEHCAQYDACSRPAYFVEDDWYNDVYAPQYREHHGHGHKHGHDKGHKD
jgi:hypothetical protein